MIRLDAKAKWNEVKNPGFPGTWYVWQDKLLSVCVDDHKGELWHLSIAHPYRYPTWDEIFTARYDLLPGDIHCAIFLPKKSEYVNIHPNCFHIFEVKEAQLPPPLIIST